MLSRSVDKARQILKAKDLRNIASNPKRQKVVKSLYFKKKTIIFLEVYFSDNQ